jgi:hypothetical protein
LAVVFQGLTFMFFGSDQFCDGDILQEIRHQKPCTISDGSTYSICAVVAYFFGLVFVCCTPKPEPLSKQKDVSHPLSKSFPVKLTPVEDPSQSATMA